MNKKQHEGKEKRLAFPKRNIEENLADILNSAIELQNMMPTGTKIR
ncbi:MAG TPA: hypothetical protein P5239_00300 [Victivallales bacterium]|nr:hypothetical protein [Victivallales bacterium]